MWEIFWGQKFLILLFVDCFQNLIQQMEILLTKKVQIPFRDQVSDRESLSELRFSQNIQRIKLQLNDSVYNGQSEQSSPGMQNRRKNNRRNILRTVNPVKLPTTNKMGLRKVLQEQKVKQIVKNFVVKLKRNLIKSAPIQFEPYNKYQQTKFWNKSGIEIPRWFDLTFAFASIIQIIVLFFVYTLALAFNEFIEDSIIGTLQTFSLCFYAMQIVINFISIKTLQGRNVKIFKQIWIHYLKRKFFVDIVCLIVLLADINSVSFVTKYARLCVVLKTKECLQKMEKIQNVFVDNFYKEQYWGLAKVFLINFGFAHILAVLLLAMASLSPSQNWLMKLKGSNPFWYQQYAWAYYWGTTIMLTVGFGDLTAVNYKQAICITLIETFSCILLAYNINCVGDMISKIRNRNTEKNKNLRTIRNLSKQNNIREDLSWKVCNFIDESDKMKKKFRYEEEKQLISKLPHQLKTEFLKLSNIEIFQSIKFLRTFSQKTLLSLAEQVQVKITHPEQLIFKCQDSPQLLILKTGEVGYCTKLTDSDFSGTVIDVLKANKNEKSKLIYLGFLSNHKKRVKFTIKSTEYSIIYFMDMEKMLSIMKNSKCDFQNYCEMRDKSKHVLDQFQIIQCSYCKTNHSKMQCPKLHYCPINQMIIYRYLSSIKSSKSERLKFPRQRTRAQLAANCPFKLKSYFQKLQEDIYKKKAGINLNKMSISKSRKSQPISKTQNEILECTVNFMSSIMAKQQQLLGLELKLVERIKQMISQNKGSENEEQFWDFECDVAQNFKFYFRSWNANQLASELTFKERTRQGKDGSSSGCFNIMNLRNSANQIESIAHQMHLQE